MSDKQILMSSKNGVTTMTLNAPKRLNALSPQMLDEMNAALDVCAADPDMRVFVLTGAGRGFCAGADLSGDGQRGATPQQRADGVHKSMNESFNPVIKKIANLNVPTIAAVNGVAAGGGYGLALACDLVMATESTKFILVFTPQLGLIPDLGASWHAPRALGRARAVAAAFFGDRMSAADAVEAGLIWRAVPDGTLIAEVDAVAGRLAAGPTKAYPAVRKAFDIASTHGLDAHLDYEADEQPKLIATEDYVEGVRAFMQKRKPEFKGR